MSAFQIEKQEKQGIDVIHISGFLDAHTAPELEKEIENLINLDKYKIIINLQKLDYISSAGLGVFMSHIELIRNNGGDIKLCNLQEKVYSVFDLLGFPMLFDINNDENESIDKFLIEN